MNIKKTFLATFIGLPIGLFVLSAWVEAPPQYTLPFSSFFAMDTVPLFISDSGKVGINTDTPQYQLDVKATSNPIRLTGLQTGSSNDSVLTVSAGVVKKISAAGLGGSTTAWSTTGNAATGNAFLGTTNNADVIIKRNNLVAMKFGNIGIGADDISIATGSSNAGPGSIALGGNNQASDYAVAIGMNNNAGGNASVALGGSSTSNGENSVAMGGGNAGGDYSVALAGFAGAVSSVAMVGGSAIGNNSISIGSGTVAKAYSSISIGMFNDNSDTPSTESPVATDRLFQIGNGDEISGSRSNALTVLRNGNTGLGTVTPQYKLDVNALSTGNPIRVQGLQQGTAADSLVTSQAGVLKRLSARDVFSVTAGTNVQITGVGTTASPYVVSAPDVVTGTRLADSVLVLKSNINNVNSQLAAETAARQATDATKLNVSAYTAPVNADWNATSGLGQIINKPQITSQWSFLGNEASSTDFLGTTNDVDMVFKRNNTEVMRLGRDAVSFGLNGVDEGTKSYAFGQNNSVTGSYGTAFGYNNSVSANYCFSTGAFNSVAADGSAAFGDNNNIMGDYTVTFGRNNTASGQASFVTGYSNTVNGDHAAAIGKTNKVSGESTLAVGRNNTTFAEYSLVVGQSNTATGGGTQFIHGDGNTVTGERSSAIGQNNTVNSNNSSTLGQNNSVLNSTTSQSYNAFAIGSDLNLKSSKTIAIGFENDDTDEPTDIFQPTDRLFQLGKGGKANAITVLRNGNTSIGDNYTPTEKLEVSGRVKAQNLRLSSIPVYSSDSAAGSGGLVQGDVFRNASGQLFIKL